MARRNYFSIFRHFTVLFDFAGMLCGRRSVVLKFSRVWNFMSREIGETSRVFWKNLRASFGPESQKVKRRKGKRNNPQRYFAPRPKLCLWSLRSPFAPVDNAFAWSQIRASARDLFGAFCSGGQCPMHCPVDSGTLPRISSELFAPAEQCFCIVLQPPGLHLMAGPLGLWPEDTPFWECPPCSGRCRRMWEPLADETNSTTISRTSDFLPPTYDFIPLFRPFRLNFILLSATQAPVEGKDIRLVKLIFTIFSFYQPYILTFHRGLCSAQ